MIYGIGINDADYFVRPIINGERVWCPYYRVWHDMLVRCYSERFHKLQSTYIDCEVCSEWQYFSKFKSWMEIQDWQGKHLDKDLLGEKLYSPETCCFVPQWLNNLFNDHGRDRGEYPLGVCQDRGKIKASIKINGKNKHLGYFDTPEAPEEAHLVYLKAKKQHVYNLMKDYPDQRVKEAVLRKVNAST